MHDENWRDEEQKRRKDYAMRVRQESAIIGGEVWLKREGWGMS